MIDYRKASIFISLLLLGILIISIGVDLDLRLDNRSSATSTPPVTEHTYPPPDRADTDLQIPPFEREPPIPLEATVSVTIEGRIVEYNNVMFCVYDADGEVIHSENIGTISTSNRSIYFTRTRYNITLQETPEYFAVDHPAIRNESGLFESIAWDPEQNRYVIHEDSNRLTEAFGFPRSNETGVCG